MFEIIVVAENMAVYQSVMKGENEWRKKKGSLVRMTSGPMSLF